MSRRVPLSVISSVIAGLQAPTVASAASPPPAVWTSKASQFTRSRSQKFYNVTGVTDDQLVNYLQEQQEKLSSMTLSSDMAEAISDSTDGGGVGKMKLSSKGSSVDASKKEKRKNKKNKIVGVRLSELEPLTAEEQEAINFFVPANIGTSELEKQIVAADTLHSVLKENAKLAMERAVEASNELNSMITHANEPWTLLLGEEYDVITDTKTLFQHYHNEYNSRLYPAYRGAKEKELDKLWKMLDSDVKERIKEATKHNRAFQTRFVNLFFKNPKQLYNKVQKPETKAEIVKDIITKNNIVRFVEGEDWQAEVIGNNRRRISVPGSAPPSSSTTRRTGGGSQRSLNTLVPRTNEDISSTLALYPPQSLTRQQRKTLMAKLWLTLDPQDQSKESLEKRAQMLRLKGL